MEPPGSILAVKFRPLIVEEALLPAGDRAAEEQIDYPTQVGKMIDRPRPRQQKMGGHAGQEPKSMA
jgi:uncharacterized cupin superfamily protein